MPTVNYPGEIKVVVYPPITKMIDIVHCSECTFFNNGFCTQYEMAVDDQDGCSNYELIRGYRGYDDGK